MSLGCRFVNVGFNQNNFQGLGIFKTSIYAEAQTGSNDLGEFLGCVNYSQFWEGQTDDLGFTAARFAGGILLGFTTLATILNICIQCFSKHGKSHLWNLMRVCYLLALAGQGTMYAIFASDMCTDLDGAQTCWPGRNGIVGVLNFVLLFGMVITTCASFPPRNPVFQCWGSQEDYGDSDEEGSTDEEDGDMKKFKSLGAGKGNYDDTSSLGDAVSLFGGSRMSRKSRKSSYLQQSSGKSKIKEEEISVAEKGLSNVNADKSISSSKSHKSKATERSMSIPGTEKYLVNTETGSVANKSASGSTSLISRRSIKSNASQKSKSASVVEPEPYLVTTEDNSVVTKSSVATNKSNRSSKSNASQMLRMLIPGAKKNLVTKKDPIDNASTSSSKSSKSHRSTQSKADMVDLTGSVASVLTNNTEEIANFIEQLVEMTELIEGGRRVKTDEQDRQIELVDEYPAKVDGEIESNPSSDLVKIRTEYYDLGSRTVKEITHSDGSRTVITTIVASPTNNETMPTEQAAADPEAVLSSEGSIPSTNSSKYKTREQEQKEIAPSTVTPAN